MRIGNATRELEHGIGQAESRGNKYCDDVGGGGGGWMERTHPRAAICILWTERRWDKAKQSKSKNLPPKGHRPPHHYPLACIDGL